MPQHLIHLVVPNPVKMNINTKQRTYIVRLGVQHDPNGNENKTHNSKGANDPIRRENRLPCLELLLLKRRV